MTHPADPKREHPSTYFVQGRSNLDEMTRLRIQDQMLTTMMGGVLPEQSNPTAFQTVLDVGCGTGNFFAPAYDGVTSHLAEQLSRFVQPVQTRAYELEFHAGTSEMEYIAEDGRLAFRNLLPFLRKWTRVPDNYDELYQQMLIDVQKPDYTAQWRIVTTWGRKSTS